MKILITGFTPFGGEKINPAWEAVKLIKDIPGIELFKREIPTVFGKSIDLVVEEAECLHPDVILCIGQAGGRVDITVERVAINIDDARIADNEGNSPIDAPIYLDGENAYFANLPIKAMVNSMKDAGIPASVSNTAGTFVCNHIMYGVLYHICKNKIASRGGFIHVPFIPEQVVGKNFPSMKLEDITKGLEAALVAIRDNREDLKIQGGREF